MSKQPRSRKTILFVLAAGAVGLAIILNIGDGKSAKANVTTSPTVAPAASAVRAAAKKVALAEPAGALLDPLNDLLRQALLERSQRSGLSRDPFAWPVERKPVVEKPKPIPKGKNLKLEGILWSETEPIAIINGDVVSLKDTLEGLTVTVITRQSVELGTGRNRIVLHLRAENEPKIRTLENPMEQP